MAEEIVVKKSYWEYLIVVSILVIAVLFGALWFSGYFGQSETGFGEKKCLNLLEQVSPDAGGVKLAEIKSDSYILKDGVLVKGSEYALRLYFQTSVRNDMLEFCRLTKFSQAAVLASSPAGKKSFLLNCKSGDLKVEYLNGLEYSYLGQELFMPEGSVLLFLADILNISGLENVEEIMKRNPESLDMQDSYQASVLFINPDAKEVLALQYAAVIETASQLKCSGTIPQDFVVLSKFSQRVPVEIK